MKKKILSMGIIFSILGVSPIAYADIGNANQLKSQSAPQDKDRALEQKIRNAVKNDDRLSLDARKIKISVKDGIVTLKGSVYNKDEGNLIERSVSDVYGVKNVDNQLKSQGKEFGYRPKEDINEPSQGNLKVEVNSPRDNYLEDSNSNDNQQETSPSYALNDPSEYNWTSDHYEPEEMITKRATLSGEYGFGNDSEYDQDLAQKIRDVLRDDESLSTNVRDIGISSLNGNIKLWGAVNSKREKSRIETKVSQIYGVKKIDNQLKIAKLDW